MRLEYTALDSQGQLVRGVQEVPSRAALSEILVTRQLDLLQVRRCWLPQLRARRPVLTLPEQIGLCQHLAHYLAAGLHLDEALRDLAGHADTPALRGLGQNLQRGLQGGMSLSQGLRPHLEASTAYIAELVAAGEQSGTLPTLLQRLGEALQRSEQWRQQARRALFYPCIAGTVAGAACVFLLLFLVPQIEGFLRASGQPLPWLSRALFALSAAVQQLWLGLLLLPLLMWALVGVFLRLYPRLYGQLACWQLSMPVFGRIQLQLQLAQLADLLALLYAAGISLATALSTCAASCRNLALAISLEEIQQSVRDGQSLSQAFTQAAGANRFYPVFFLHLLHGGEKTGQLEHSLRHVSERYNASASAAIARLHTLIEPALTLVVGVFLGWVVIATMQPLYALIGEAL